MLVEEGTEDGKERLLLRELNCAKEKVTLETWVDNKGTCSRIHSGYIHCALDLFDCQFLSVIPMFIVLMLTHKSDGALCVVLIESGHVQIIDKVDELELTDRPVDFTSSSLELLFKDCLKQH